MSDLYQASPANYGGFPPVMPGGSSSKGFYQQPQNLPFFTGRSILASIPEYLRNPLQMEKDLMFKLTEGRPNLMKILLEQVELGGGIEVNDVRFRLPIDVEPNSRIYLDTQTAVSTNAAGTATFKVKGNTTKITTAKSGGNPKQVGDIARLEAGQFIMLMFSWVEPRRTAAVDGSKLTYYSPNALGGAPVPEICKITSINYAASTITVQRYWAGEQRTSTPTYTNVATIAVVANTGTNVWSDGAGTAVASIQQKYAFFIPMAKSMKEDEIDAKISNYSGTWAYGILQRDLKAWGSEYFAQVISNNMGIEDPYTKTKRLALKDFYDTWEWQALFGEKSESFDAETNYWSGTTDGLLANIPKSHYWKLKGIDYSSGFTNTSTANLGSFHPLIFNKVLEGKALIGSQNKVIVCGSAFYNAFCTSINFMTQAVPDIKSEWTVMGKRFSSSDGLVVDVIPSDKMTLNGMTHSAILYDKQYFKAIKLRNYPSADIYEINNENPLKRNGFIHGVKGFIDLNPDAHWVFTIEEKKLADGTDNGTSYDKVDPLGEPFE